VLRGPKKLFVVFFSFCYNSCWGSRILLKFCMSNLDVVFHIWCKRLDLFWSVRGLNSKMPTYPTCQLTPLSPIERKDFMCSPHIKNQRFRQRFHAVWRIASTAVIDWMASATSIRGAAIWLMETFPITCNGIFRV
jgi:hypothetical protein